MKKSTTIAALALVGALALSALAGCGSSNSGSSASESASASASAPATSIPNDAKVGDIVQLGVYEQDGNESNGKEPIDWRVLSVENGKTLLISVCALDAKPFNESKDKGNDWETSDLKAWLEGEFKTTAGLDSVKGELTCLNDAEAYQYFASDSERVCEATDYAKKQGAYSKNGGCYWWLSSSDNSSTRAQKVQFDGYIIKDGGFVDGETTAVRPALWVTTSASSSASSSVSASASNSSSAPAPSLKSVKVGDAVELGAYEQDNVESNGKEPIQWRVLAVEDGKALLISEYALDAHAFNGTKEYDWETSDLKAWLEGEFKTAAGLDDVKGELTCLSVDEAKTYFATSDDRDCQATEYAYKQGVRCDSAKDVTCIWWLRSPGQFSDYASIVRGHGFLKEVGACVDSADIAVRPAMWVTL